MVLVEVTFDYEGDAGGNPAGGGGGVLDGRDVLDLMHGRSRMTIEPRPLGGGILICCLP